MRPISIALPLLLLAACTSEPREPADPADDPARELGSYEVDPETGEISARVHRDDGSVATMRSGENVPLELPAGFTAYPDAQVVSNTRIDHGDGQGTMLVMESEASPANMIGFYRKQAEAAGIEIEVEMTAGSTQMLAGKGPNGRSFSFNVSEESGATMAQLMVGSGLD